MLISLILIPQFCYVVDIFCMDWWILFILQLFYELFHDVEKFIDFFEIRNCVFPVMKNCSSKSILFHTHTQTALGAQGCGPYRLFAITIGHVSAIFTHIYNILCLEKRPHTQHPEQKNAKWFLIYRFALLGMFFSWVASVSQLLNDMFAQNIGKMPRSPSPSRFSHLSNFARYFKFHKSSRECHMALFPASHVVVVGGGFAGMVVANQAKIL